MSVYGILPSVARRIKIPAKKLGRAGGDQRTERSEALDGLAAVARPRAQTEAARTQRSVGQVAAWLTDSGRTLESTALGSGHEAWVAARGGVQGQAYSFLGEVAAPVRAARPQPKKGKKGKGKAKKAR